MTLPELDLQIIYGRLAWTVVLAALTTALWPASIRVSRRTVAFLLAGAATMTVLPGAASPAYWLVLVFQWPSGLLVGFCLVRLWAVSQGKPHQGAMPFGLAALIALVGAALYLDAIGLLSRGFYYWGFSPVSAPLFGLILAAGCSVAAASGYVRPQAWALLGAVTMFAVLRLPTGNLWDALLDPILWGWALASLGSGVWRRWNAPKQAPSEQVSSFANAPAYEPSMSIDADPAAEAERV